MSENVVFDRDLEYDETTGEFCLTEECIRKNCGDIRSRLSGMGEQDKSQAISQFSKRVSLLIYNIIWNNSKICLYNDNARAILKRAMINQASFMIRNGDLSQSTKNEERAIKIDPEVIGILNRTIAGVGHSLMYCGV